MYTIKPKVSSPHCFRIMTHVTYGQKYGRKFFCVVFLIELCCHNALCEKR